MDGYIIYREGNDDIGEVTPVYVVRQSPVTKLFTVALVGEDRTCQVREVFYKIEAAERKLIKIAQVAGKLAKVDGAASQRMKMYAIQCIRRSPKYRYLKTGELAAAIMSSSGVDLENLTNKDARGLIGRFSKPYRKRK